MDERPGPGEVVDEGHQRAGQGPDGGDAADWIVSVRSPLPGQASSPHRQQVHRARADQRESEPGWPVSGSRRGLRRQMDVVYSADMVSHWEDGDACVHELFYNVSLVAAARLWADEMTQDSIICTCISLAVRSSSV